MSTWFKEKVLRRPDENLKILTRSRLASASVAASRTGTMRSFVFSTSGAVKAAM